jgi:hypothetical protein
MTASGEQVVRGLRAAARATGRSASGVQKLVDAGRLPARRDGAAFEFSVADLEAVRRVEPPGLIAATVVNAAPPSDVPALAVPTPAVDHVGQSEHLASTVHPSDDGAVASQVFADLAAGKPLTQIVIDRHLAPDVVRRVHAEWLALSDVDGLKKPTAEARLVEAEADIRALDGRLSAAEAAIEETSVEHGRTHELERRVRSLETRGRATGVPAAVLQRLDALEQQVRSLPAAPLLLHDWRCGCGGSLLVAASCSVCGSGRMAS